MKTYYTTDNVGKAKYTVSYHDGKQFHTDKSPFYGIKTFKNKKKKETFIKELIGDGYQKA
jgi:hypothetical protein